MGQKIRNAFSIGLLAATFALGSPQGDVCYPNTRALHYPPLAKAARVDGTVTATVHINSGGKMVIDSAQGQALLVAQAKADFASITLPLSCTGRKIKIQIVYGLRTPGSGDQKDDVESATPGVYRVTGTPLLISDPPAELSPRPSWLRRLFHRLF